MTTKAPTPAPITWTDKWGERHDLAGVEQDHAERILLHLIRTAPQRERRRRMAANPFVWLPEELVEDAEFREVSVRNILRTPEAKAVMHRLGNLER